MTKDIFGVIPAASRATRLPPLPFSKVLFPVGLQESRSGNETRLHPKIAGQYILENLRMAGAEHIFIIIGEKAESLINYFGNGNRFGVEIAYIFQDNYKGIPYALDLINPWLSKDATILFGMPDTIVKPEDIFVYLLSEHNKSQATLTLGCFQTETPNKFGMIDFDSDFRVCNCLDKPQHSKLKYMWGIAAWQKEFSDFISKYLKQLPVNVEKEIVLGDVIQQAIVEGVDIRAACFDTGDYLDIGTMDDLLKAVRQNFIAY